LGHYKILLRKDILETKAQRDKEIASLGVKVPSKKSGVFKQNGPLCVEDFDFVSILGMETFDNVRLVRHKGLNRSFAMKCLRKSIIVAMHQEQNIFNEKVIGILMRSNILKLEEIDRGLHKVELCQ
jgi:hypothetical protein